MMISGSGFATPETQMSAPKRGAHLRKAEAIVQCSIHISLNETAH